MALSLRTRVCVVIGIIIGSVIAAFFISKNPVQEVRYVVSETKSEADLRMQLASSIDFQSLSQREKNKIVSRQRVFQEIGAIPSTAIYQVSPLTLSSREQYCLALNIYHEARGEGSIGMLGVAQVTLNRLDQQYRGKKTLCSVVYDTKQFSWTLDTQKRNKRPTGDSWYHSKEVALLAVQGWRIAQLEQSLHYHADWIKHPNWSRKMALSHLIGQHLFFTKV